MRLYWAFMLVYFMSFKYSHAKNNSCTLIPEFESYYDDWKECPSSKFMKENNLQQCYDSNAKELVEGKLKISKPPETTK